MANLIAFQPLEMSTYRKRDLNDGENHGELRLESFFCCGSHFPEDVCSKSWFAMTSHALTFILSRKFPQQK